MYELSKEFRFDAAHTLVRTIETEGSRRIHGHSYRAIVTLRGMPDALTGMIIDLGYLDQLLAELRDALDHRMLDDVDGLGPATIENLSAFIFNRLATKLSNLAHVCVKRDSYGDSCTYYGPESIRR